MNLKVKRLHQLGESGRRYHIFDQDGHVLFVADQGGPWLPSDTHRSVRLSRPDGEEVASLDLSVPGETRTGKTLPHALIVDHAVYALISQFIHDGEPGEAAPRFVVEVEGNQWVALGDETDSDRLLALYDIAPSDVRAFGAPADLPEPVAVVSRLGDEYDFLLVMPGSRLSQGPLLGLALVYLFDAHPAPR